MDELKHIGTKRHSGRYPWGSGDEPFQRSKSFLAQIEEYRKMGMSEESIAKAVGVKNTGDLRRKTTTALAFKKAEDTATAMKLADKGMSNLAIARQMGISDHTVEALLNPAKQARAKEIFNTANVLAAAVDEKRWVDVGAGTEQQLGISRTKLDAALNLLKEDGYHVFYDYVPQQTVAGKKTSLRVLAPPNPDAKAAYREMHQNQDKIRMIQNYSEDGGMSWAGIETPASVKKSRIYVRYKEEGGADRDGLIELRRGVPDISLGNARYAQVRMSVDGTHYMKGMAVHTDKIPDGYDIVYNSNKTKDQADKVFKPIKDDPGNPFGAVIRQKHYIDSKGVERLSALNMVGSQNNPTSGEEGSWQEWSRTISSQVLSKQRPTLAKKQLQEAFDRKKDEYDEIMSLTNPAVKKRLLETFSDSCDNDAVHLKGAALPRQVSQVLLPFPSVKEHEVYAPQFRDGETVVLIRHPHGGVFEIPELIVNNKNRDAIESIGRDARDAVGINPKTAAKLSGADFDGDSVLVIPNSHGAIATKPPLRELADFDPKTRYPETPGMRYMTAHTKGMEMGNISNLITDMTIQGAKDSELARAVKHSMVVIDAEKHKLNYQLSAQENNIAELKAKYQGGPKSGAATLISRASSDARVPDRRPGKPPIDPKTGKKNWEYTGETYVKTGTFIKDPATGKYLVDPATGKRLRKEFKTPKTVTRTITSTKMAEADDAYDLLSDNGGTRIERIYADHANALKSLANKARKSSVEIGPIPYSPAAREIYKTEVDSLTSQLNLAKRNKPFERQAQIVANREVSAILRENPTMDDDHIKKIRAQALTAARVRVGAHKPAVEFSDREWEAIQAGAISSNFLRELLLNADLSQVKQRAMPRANMVMSPARVARARAMRDNDSTIAEIAQALGVSTTAVDEVLR